jgi:hydroxymethylbilane synthase
MTKPLLRIGTRGSPLALIQAEEVQRRLAAAHPELAPPGALEIVVIRTTGDLVRDRTLAAIGGKGLFIKEIEEALVAGTIDLAVHSMKDVTTWLPEGLVIGAVLEREDPRDALFSAGGAALGELPPGAVIGTASLRRQAQVLRLRPDLRVVPLRGNVDTRLKKLAEGAVDATLLALAGIKRLGATDRVTAILDPALMLPAVAQGAIGVELRAGDTKARAWLAALNHGPSATCVAAERAFLAALDGSCKTPIAGLAEIAADGTLQFRGMIIRPDGAECHETTRLGAPRDAEAIGRDAGEELHARAGADFFDLPIPAGEPA